MNFLIIINLLNSKLKIYFHNLYFKIHFNIIQFKYRFIKYFNQYVKLLNQNYLITFIKSYQ